MLLGGGLTVLRGREWAGLSARYEVPSDDVPAAGPVEAATDKQAWDALDRGHDPTA
jgi:hypothetical protein